MYSSKDCNIILVLFFLIGIFLLPLLYMPGLSFELIEAGKLIFLFVVLLFLELFCAARAHMERAAPFVPIHALFHSILIVFAVTILSALFSKIPDVSWVGIGDSARMFLFFYLLFAIFFFTVYLFKKRWLISYLNEVVIFSFLTLWAISTAVAFIKNITIIDTINSFIGSVSDTVVFAGLVFVLSLFLFRTPMGGFKRVFASVGIILSVIVLFFSFSGETKPSFSLVPIENITVLQGTVKESPFRALLGSGPNTALYQFDLYAPEQTPLASWNAHILTQTGLLGGFAWALFFFLFIFYGIQSFLQKNQASVFSFIIALYLWIFSFLYPMGLTLTVFTFLFTGVYITALSYGEQEKNASVISLEKKWVRATFASLVSIVFLLSMFGVGLYTKKTISFFYFQKALAVENEELFLEDVGNALRVSKEGIYYRHLANFYILKIEEVSNLSVFAGRDAEIVKYGELAVANAKQATEIAPYDYRNWEALGRIYLIFQRLGISGSYEQGRRAYSEAYFLSPKNKELLEERIELAFRAEDEHYRELINEYPVKTEIQEKLQQWVFRQYPQRSVVNN